jgi:hypothetical protein
MMILGVRGRVKASPETGQGQSGEAKRPWPEAKKGQPEAENDDFGGPGTGQGQSGDGSRPVRGGSKTA